MLRIGLTGGIGVGKTVCAQIFESIGVPIYYSDTEAKKIMVENGPVRTAIMNLFGKNSYQKDGSLSRQHLSSIIFKDPAKLAHMNAIVHPAVRTDFIQWCEKKSQHAYVIQESALIFETGSYKLFDKNILVHAPFELRIDRVLKRDRVTRESVLARMNKQMPQEEKFLLSDYVIANDGQESLIDQIFTIHRELLRLSDVSS